MIKLCSLNLFLCIFMCSLSAMSEKDPLIQKQFEGKNLNCLSKKEVNVLKKIYEPLLNPEQKNLTFAYALILNAICENIPNLENNKDTR